MGMQTVTPASEALSARLAANQQQQNIASTWNAAQLAIYAEEVFQQYTWPKYFENSPNEPMPAIPDPPQGYVLQTQPATAYDQAFGLPPAVVAVLSGPVCPKYVDPATTQAVVLTPKPGTVLDIGAPGRNGEYYCQPDDNMPVGQIVQGPGGVWLQKQSSQTPFGIAYFYAPAPPPAKS